MCYSGRCEYEDHMGNCTLHPGDGIQCPNGPPPEQEMVTTIAEIGGGRTLAVRKRYGQFYLESSRSDGGGPAYVIYLRGLEDLIYLADAARDHLDDLAGKGETQENA